MSIKGTVSFRGKSGSNLFSGIILLLIITGMYSCEDEKTIKYKQNELGVVIETTSNSDGKKEKRIEKSTFTPSDYYYQICNNKKATIDKIDMIFDLYVKGKVTIWDVIVVDKVNGYLTWTSPKGSIKGRTKHQNREDMFDRGQSISLSFIAKSKELPCKIEGTSF